MSEKPIKMSKSWVLGARLMASRQLANFKRKKAAEKLGVSSTTLGNYESGATEPPLAALIQLARLYQDSLALLLDDLELDPVYFPVDDYELVRVGYRLQYLRGGRARSWLAKQAGLTLKEVHLIELGAARPSETVFNDIADVLGIKPVYIKGKGPCPKQFFPRYAESKAGEGQAQFPPLNGGFEQANLCIPTEHLIKLDVGEPRVFYCP